MNKNVSCIVAAGGLGSRMGENINKLFLEIDQIPVIAHTLSALESSQTISEIIIAAREEEIMYISELVSAFGITKVKTIVKGGATRGESVLAASKEVSSDCDVVIVHDGARPLVTDEIISNTVNSAASFGAAACGVKPKCTLKAVDDARIITDTVDREKTLEIQTPQAFVKELFDRMYGLDIQTVRTSTDDCMLAEKCSAKIYVTEGSYRNIKITTPEDLEIAEIFLRRY